MSLVIMKGQMILERGSEMGSGHVVKERVSEWQASMWLVVDVLWMKSVTFNWSGHFDECLKSRNWKWYTDMVCGGKTRRSMMIDDFCTIYLFSPWHQHRTHQNQPNKECMSINDIVLTKTKLTELPANVVVITANDSNKWFQLWEEINHITWKHTPSNQWPFEQIQLQLQAVEIQWTPWWRREKSNHFQISVIYVFHHNSSSCCSAWAVDTIISSMPICL